jgi:hypothetical protein
MRAGRRRKKGKRERNGRVQRPPAVDRDVCAVVLAQPHRRGSRDPFCESPLGRFVLRHGLDRLTYDAALGYAHLVRRVFAAKGIPQPVRDGHRATPGQEMRAETARHLQNTLEQIEKRLRGIGHGGVDAVCELAVYEREALPGQTEEASLVLLELGMRAPGKQGQ